MASREWFEFHLTPKGWIDGSEKLDGASVKIVPPPPDRVLSVKLDDYTRTIEELFRSPDAVTVEELTKKYGSRPPMPGFK